MGCRMTHERRQTVITRADPRIGRRIRMLMCPAGNHREVLYLGRGSSFIAGRCSRQDFKSPRREHHRSAARCACDVARLRLEVESLGATRAACISSLASALPAEDLTLSVVPVFAL